MREQVKELLKMGKIPRDDEMSDELFNKYDELIQIDEPLTCEEAEILVKLFSDDCPDLNWGLIHKVESVFDSCSDKEYRNIIMQCNNEEYRELMCTRLDNYIKDKEHGYG